MTNYLSSFLIPRILLVLDSTLLFFLVLLLALLLNIQTVNVMNAQAELITVMLVPLAKQKNLM